MWTDIPYTCVMQCCTYSLMTILCHSLIVLAGIHSGRNRYKDTLESRHLLPFLVVLPPRLPPSLANAALPLPLLTVRIALRTFKTPSPLFAFFADGSRSSF